MPGSAAMKKAKRSEHAVAYSNPLLERRKRGRYSQRYGVREHPDFESDLEDSDAGDLSGFSGSDFLSENDDPESSSEFLSENDDPDAAGAHTRQRADAERARKEMHAVQGGVAVVAFLLLWAVFQLCEDPGVPSPPREGGGARRAGPHSATSSGGVVAGAGAPWDLRVVAGAAVGGLAVFSGCVWCCCCRGGEGKTAPPDLGSYDVEGGGAGSGDYQPPVDDASGEAEDDASKMDIAEAEKGTAEVQADDVAKMDSGAGTGAPAAAAAVAAAAKKDSTATAKAVKAAGAPTNPQSWSRWAGGLVGQGGWHAVSAVATLVPMVFHAGIETLGGIGDEISGISARRSAAATGAAAKPAGDA